MTVRAMVIPALDGRPADWAMAAIEVQTRPPDEVGATGEADWVWLVEAAVAPLPDALERLLDVASVLDRAVLLASKVVLRDGAPDPLALPVPAVADPDDTLDAFERRLVSLRAARRGSLLVRAEALAGADLSRGDDLLWSARALRSAPGYLVPASVVVRAPGVPGEERRRARAGLADWLALVRSDALAREEKPWFAFRLAEQAVGAVRR